MKRVYLGLLLLPLVALMFAGCAPGRSGTFTIASTTMGANDLGGNFVLVQKDATASHTVPIVIFPFGVPQDYKAMEDILEDTGGDILANVRVTYKTTLVLFLFGSAKANVTCDVWRKAGPDDLGALSQDKLYSLEEIGKVDYSNIALVESPTEGRPQ